ncbi:hypothetical protein [Bradyrhizobium iriomotense]|uniref:Uncharacterized protein n=1 Tax=Bradyrhizobium iriomotense TaxID=441950 RepID=A0ABQ6B6E0_9BRAD|nr:hypothetical protein [Bradyrhizobium iriomotense]GLR89967.1 hypothetical protein GCM10007857_66810 [Bradyrhizobium iriomotense]
MAQRTADSFSDLRDSAQELMPPGERLSYVGEHHQSIFGDLALSEAVSAAASPAELYCVARTVEGLNRTQRQVVEVQTSVATQTTKRDRFMISSLFRRESATALERETSQ